MKRSCVMGAETWYGTFLAPCSPRNTVPPLPQRHPNLLSPTASTADLHLHSSPDANFASLPIELATMIAACLPPDDLLAVRSITKTWSRISNDFLANLLSPRLGRLHLLTTRDGLLTLQGLLSIPKWRNQIKSVDFVDHGFYPMELE
jgi:hypothetical protein